MRRHFWFRLGAVPLLIVLAACSDGVPLPTQARPASESTLAAKSGGGSRGSTTVPVTSNLTDDASLQIRSDGSGPYTNSQTLKSIVSRDLGDWTLDLTNSTRTIYLDFSRGIPGSGPDGGDPVPLASGYYQVHMISKCHLTGESFLTIAAGQTVLCPLHIGQIYVGTREYSVTMNPGVTSNGTSWPETNYASVTCNSAAAGSCASWTITPSGAVDGLPANVGALIETVTSSGKGRTTTTLVKQGDFYLSFLIDVTDP